MAGDSFTININLDNMTKGIKDIKKIERAITRGVELGIDELCNRLKSKMIEYLVLYGLGDSNLVNEILVLKTKNGVVLTAGADYAMFVEYGTGIVGATNPHPHPWAYDINGHGDNGWYYPTTDDDPNPNKHVYNGQLYAWTKGMPSRPFMYKAWLWGTRSATQIIKKNINNQLKKVSGVR